MNVSWEINFLIHPSWRPNFKAGANIKTKERLELGWRSRTGIRVFYACFGGCISATFAATSKLFEEFVPTEWDDARHYRPVKFQAVLITTMFGRCQNFEAK